MLDYLRGKIKVREDEAALGEIFNLGRSNLAAGGGRFVNEAINAAAKFLHMKGWAEAGPAGVSIPPEAARLGFGLILQAYGSEETRASDRERLREYGGDINPEAFGLDEAIVELSYLELFATHYAILRGEPASDSRRLLGEAFLRCLLELERFTVDPGKTFEERHRRFLLYQEAADKEDNWRQSLRFGEVFSALCGAPRSPNAREFWLMVFGGGRFGIYAGYAGRSVENFLGMLDAASAAREALRLNPSDEIAHYNLGVALTEMGDWNGAVLEYREAVRLNPNFAEAHCKLGVALDRAGHLDGAVAEYGEALRLNPGLVEARHNLGVALEQKGDRQGALDEYHAACLIDPESALYKQNYATLHAHDLTERRTPDAEKGTIEEQDEKWREAFAGQRNTPEVLAQKADALALVVGLCVEHTYLSLLKKISELDTSLRKEPITERQFVPAYFEWMWFYIHLIDRMAFDCIGPEKRSTFIDALADKVIEFFRQAIERADPELLRMGEEAVRKAGLRSGFLEGFSARQLEYAKYPNWLARENEAFGGALFWEFGKKIAAVVGRERDPSVILTVQVQLADPVTLKPLLVAVEILPE